MATEEDDDLSIFLSDEPYKGETQESQQEETQSEEQQEETQEESTEQQTEDQTQETETETQSETETETQEEEVVVDYKSLFGEEYDSPDKVKDAIGKVKKLEQDLKEVQEKKPEFADPRVERLNGLLLNNPKMDLTIANKLSSLDDDTLKGMDDRALMKLKMQLETPALANDDRLLGRMMDKSYMKLPSQELLDDMSDDEVEDLKDEVKLAEIKLRQDAGQFRDTLTELLTKATPIKEAPEDLQAKREKILTEWTEPAKTIIAKEISIPDGDWNKVLLKYAIDDTEFASLTASVPKYAADNNIPFTEDNFKMIGGQIMSNYIMGKLPKIIKAVTDKVRADVMLEAEKKYTNPSAHKTETKGKPKSMDEDITVWL